jgi:DHA2 family multidrug resistance protein
LHHAQLVDRLTGSDPASAQALASLQAGGLGQQQSYGVLNRLVDQQAFMLSADDIFYVSGLLFLALIFVIWLAHPQKGAAAAGAVGSGAH